MKDIKFTSSPWGFRRSPIKEQCEWLKVNGIGHICGQFMAGESGLFDPEISDGEIAKAVDLVTGCGLSYASFNGDGDFMVEKNVADEIALTCSRIDKAAKFSPEVIIVFAGWQDRDDDGAYAQVSEALGEVARYAGKYGLTVALENHGGLTTRAAQVNRILDGVKEPNIGVNFDAANFLMYGEDPYKALLELKHEIVFTHFKSLKKVDGEKVYCRLCEGEIDYVPILKWLGTNYDGFYGLEYEEIDDVFAGSQDDFNSLKQLLMEV